MKSIDATHAIVDTIPVGCLGGMVGGGQYNGSGVGEMVETSAIPYMSREGEGVLRRVGHGGDRPCGGVQSARPSRWGVRCLVA